MALGLVTLQLALGDPLGVATAVALRCIEELNTSHAILPSEWPYNFGNWNYEGGAIQIGLWELTPHLAPADATRVKEALRYRLESNGEGKEAASILSNGTKRLKWGYSIGDSLGLYPAAYAARLRYDDSSSSTDRSIARLMPDLMATYPLHVNASPSRDVDWVAAGYLSKGRGVWGDDAFMGTAVLVASNSTIHLKRAAEQVLGYHGWLRDSTDGLYHHGAVVRPTGVLRSCCKWGRANGWALMGKVDTLVGMKENGMEGSTEYQSLLAAFKEHLSGVLGVVDSGLLHNVLNETTTPPEVSSTAMTLYALTTGLTSGVLPADFSPVPPSVLFEGIAANIAATGEVSGVIGETGIKDNWKRYGTPKGYEWSAPGLGGVLRGLASYLRYTAAQQA
eukprot:Hpha_TRINITY_DN15687_c5_g7::TRINITY_DN15687_c5_g7_i1::g.99130::m.99130/K15532/yteR, yesR; unsaturated rhamnogalacturonyl hydrolase